MSRISHLFFAFIMLCLTANAAEALCVINETGIRLSVHAGKDTPFAVGPKVWNVKIPSGHKACCPRNNHWCKKKVIRFNAYLFESYLGSKPNTPKGPKIKVGPFGKIPTGPIRPYMGKETIVCGINVKRGDTIRLYWNTYRRGCEVWRGRRIMRTTCRPKCNGYARSHLFFCNKTRQPKIYVTYAAYADKKRGWTATGWYSINRNACRKMTLPTAYYGDTYVYATGGGKVWSTKDAYFCVNSSKPYTLVNADRKRCPAGQKKQGFIKIKARKGIMNFNLNPL